MKYLKYIFFLLLIVIIGAAIYIAVQPNTFKVERSKTISAPVAVVYNEVIDFKNWEAWSALKEEQPNVKIVLPKQTKGIGGSYSWQNKDEIGTMKTVAATANTSIVQELQFSDFPKSDVNWDFKANGNGTTNVTWTIKGENMPFLFKAMVLAMGGMESQIAPHYERGLVLLDSVIQNKMKRYSIKVNGVTEHSGGYYIYNTASCKFSDLQKTMAANYPKIMTYANKNGITMAGKPFVIYHKWDEANDAVIFSCAIPTTTKVASTSSNVLTGQLLPFKTVKTTLTGSYDYLKDAWAKTMHFVDTNDLKLKASGPKIETYLTDPVSFPNPADWKTEIYIAIE